MSVLNVACSIAVTEYNQFFCYFQTHCNTKVFVHKSISIYTIRSIENGVTIAYCIARGVSPETTITVFRWTVWYYVTVLYTLSRTWSSTWTNSKQNDRNSRNSYTHSYAMFIFSSSLRLYVYVWVCVSLSLPFGWDAGCTRSIEPCERHGESMELYVVRSSYVCIITHWE